MCSFDDVKNFHWKSPKSTTDSATPKVSSTKEFMDKWRGFMTARKVKYFYKGTNSSQTLICLLKIQSLFWSGLCRMSTYSPSWISKFLVSAWDSCFVSQKLAHLPRRLWTKTRTSTRLEGREQGLQKIQDGEDIDILGSPASDWTLQNSLKASADFMTFIVLCLYSLLGQTFKLKEFDFLLYYIIFHIMFSLFRQVFFFATYDKEPDSKF